MMKILRKKEWTMNERKEISEIQLILQRLCLGVFTTEMSYILYNNKNVFCSYIGLLLSHRSRLKSILSI